MKRFWLLAFLLSVLIPAGARADSPCSGVAPAESYCVKVLTFAEAPAGFDIARSPDVELVQATLVGRSRGDASVQTVTCATNCSKIGDGWFDKGDEVVLVVSAVGVGSWSFSVRYDF